MNFKKMYPELFKDVDKWVIASASRSIKNFVRKGYSSEDILREIKEKSKWKNEKMKKLSKEAICKMIDEIMKEKSLINSKKSVIKDKNEGGKNMANEKINLDEIISKVSESLTPKIDEVMKCIKEGTCSPEDVKKILSSEVKGIEEKVEEKVGKNIEPVKKELESIKSILDEKIKSITEELEKAKETFSKKAEVKEEASEKEKKKEDKDEKKEHFHTTAEEAFNCPTCGPVLLEEAKRRLAKIEEEKKEKEKEKHESKDQDIPNIVQAELNRIKSRLDKLLEAQLKVEFQNKEEKKKAKKIEVEKVSETEEKKKEKPEVVKVEVETDEVKQPERRSLIDKILF